MFVQENYYSDRVWVAKYRHGSKIELEGNEGNEGNGTFQ
jgi:hypothetical protein